MWLRRRLRLLSRRERSGVPVGGHQGVRHHQTEDQRVVSTGSLIPGRPIRSHNSRFKTATFWGEAVTRATASITEGRFYDFNMKKGQRRVTTYNLWKRENNKEQIKICSVSCSCVSSRHDEHCAFSLKFFTVLAQLVPVKCFLSFDLRDDSFSTEPKKTEIIIVNFKNS